MSRFSNAVSYRPVFMHNHLDFEYIHQNGLCLVFHSIEQYTYVVYVEVGSNDKSSDIDSKVLVVVSFLNGGYHS